MDYTRKAAAAADAGTLASIEAIRDGASDYEVSAECHRAMILAGSEYPGFGPFIRPTTRLGEEHTTWRGEVFKDGDAIFLEIGAAYRKYQAPMGRLVYVGSAPDGAEKSADMAIKGMNAICAAIKPGGKAGDAYAAWREVARDHGLIGYERPPLRLLGFYRLPTQLDGRQYGHFSRAEFRAGTEGRYDFPHSFLVYEHRLCRLFYFKYGYVDREWVRNPHLSNTTNSDR